MKRGAAASASTTSHCAASMETTEKTRCKGGMHSTESCMAIPMTNARFMALLVKIPMWSREWCSLRTSKAWNSWHMVRVAKAMVLAVALALVGSLRT